jgi:hypothetical protein
METREGGALRAEDGTSLVAVMPSFSSLLPVVQSVYAVFFLLSN